MKIGSMFSGIGGLELGLERAGVGHTVWQVEQDAWCRSVLAQHWPEVVRYEDVRNVGAHNLPQAEVICGGFPCQDLSVAGKRAGLDGDRSGLWWEMRRIVGELRPQYVVLENVAAILADGAAGVVVGALAELGYDAVWGVVHAEDVGAPHKRARWFCVAWLADANGVRQLQPQGSQCDERGRAGDCGEAMVYAVRPGRQERDAAPEPSDAGHPAGGCDPLRRGWRAEPRLGGGADGLPAGLDRWPARPGEAQHPWEPPRTTARGAPHLNRRLKALGNAVVPQVAEVIGHWLMLIHDRQQEAAR